MSQCASGTRSILFTCDGLSFTFCRQQQVRVGKVRLQNLQESIQGHQLRPQIGVQADFATRSPVRPNPIGLALVELLTLEEDRLRVRGLDAYDGTPVLDLKPYLPAGESMPDARVPEWLVRLQTDEG